MKINKKPPIDVITIIENEKHQDIKIPNETYSLSDVEALYIKTSIFTQRTVYNQVNLDRTKSVKLFMFGYIIGDYFLLIESTDTSTCVYRMYRVFIPTHFFILDEKNSKQQFNYVIGNFATLDSNKKVERGISIMKIPKFINSLDDFEVYPTLQELKSNSLEYKKLDNRQKQKVIENIIESENMIFKNMEHTTMSVFLVQHILLGNTSKGKATGIDHIHPIFAGFAYVENITKYPNKNGVWEGTVGYIDKRSISNNKVNHYKKKDNPSTFFPNHWNTIVLIEECDYAITHKQEPFIDEKTNQTKWKSKTKSGIEVEIWTDRNEKPTSIYPIYES